jgi:hypothetical protein
LCRFRFGLRTCAWRRKHYCQRDSGKGQSVPMRCDFAQLHRPLLNGVQKNTVTFV